MHDELKRQTYELMLQHPTWGDQKMAVQKNDVYTKNGRKVATAGMVYGSRKNYGVYTEIMLDVIKNEIILHIDSNYD
jgi:hypothetical protein